MNFLIFLTVTIIAAINLARCGQHHAIDDIQYYVSYPRKENWYMALRFCAYKSMDLIDVRDPEENYRIKTIINKPEYLHVVDPIYWTSGTDMGNESSWYWITTGQPIKTLNLIAGEPTGNHYAENCLVILKKHDFKWDDVRCGTKNYYICRGRQSESKVIDIQES